MGLTFLHNYYAVFDPKQQRVGLVESIKNVDPNIRIKKVSPQVSLVHGEIDSGEPFKGLIWGMVLIILALGILQWLKYKERKANEEVIENDLSAPLLISK